MPLEVREIGIHVDVGGEDRDSEAAPRDAWENEIAARLNAAERAALIDECVAAVLAELARRREP